MGNLLNIIDILAKNKFSVEGDSGYILHSGSLRDYLEQLDSNIRSCMSYIDASNLDEIYKFGQLRRISFSAAHEGRSQLINF
jgi:IMP dehydrogenase/GMP reductase